MTLAGFWNYSNIIVFPFLHKFWSFAFFNLSFFLMDRKTFLSMGIKPKGAQMLRTRFFCQKIEPRGCREMKENFIKLSIFCILYFSTSPKIAQKALLKVCPPELVTKIPCLVSDFLQSLDHPNLLSSNLLPNLDLGFEQQRLGPAPQWRHHHDVHVSHWRIPFATHAARQATFDKVNLSCCYFLCVAPITTCHEICDVLCYYGIYGATMYMRLCIVLYNGYVMIDAMQTKMLCNEWFYVIEFYLRCYVKYLLCNVIYD